MQSMWRVRPLLLLIGFTATVAPLFGFLKAAILILVLFLATALLAFMAAPHQAATPN
jgi:hypothetical protein